MKKTVAKLIILVTMLLSSQWAMAAGLEYMDMNNWIQTGPGLASWEVAAGGRTVSQGVNGEPSFFISKSDYQNVVFKSTLEVTVTNDDDMIGVVASFHSPLDTSSNFFKTILFDWKQTGQNFDGYVCEGGMALSDVEGTINIVPSTKGTPGYHNLHTYFWSKEDPDPDNDPKWDVLDTHWGSTKGWADNTKYQFEMLVTDTQIKIKIDGQLKFDQAGSFEPGRLGFYNFSQDGVVYGNVQMAPGSTVQMAPVTQDDRYGTTPGTTIKVDRFEGLLKNDYDPNLDDVSIELVSSVKNGHLTLYPSGAFDYIPNSGFEGGDSFTYKVVDEKSAESVINTVTLGVINNNQAPTNITLSKNLIEQGSAANTIIGTFATLDANNPVDQHDYALIDNGGGRFKIVGNELRVADSALLTGGAYTIRVRSMDLMSLTLDKSFTIYVNTPPAGADGTVSTEEDTTYTLSTDDFTYVDANGDSFAGIRIETVETAGDLEYHGVDVFPGTVVSDITRLSFAPEPNAAGDAYATFDFKVMDARGAISEATYRMTINVTAVDDEPVLANPISDVIVNEDALDTVINLANVFTDVDSVITKSVSSNSNPALVIASIVDDVLTLSYEADRNGVATITVCGSADGKMVDDSFEVTVNAVNDLPVITDQTFLVEENSATGTGIGLIAATDVDADQRLSYAITGGNTGDAFAINSLTGELTVNSALLDYEGASTYTLMVAVTDNGEPPLGSSATITINVTDVNDPPTAASGSVSITEDEAYTFATSDFGYVDQDGDVLSAIEIVSIAGKGSFQLDGSDLTVGNSVTKADLDVGALTFLPAPDENGMGYASFEFMVSDGTHESVVAYTMIIDVTTDDDGPGVQISIDDVEVDEDAANTIIDLSPVFADIDNEQAEIAKVVLNNTNESLVTAIITDNLLTLAYQPDQFGTAIIVIQGESNGKTVEDSFTVTVNAVNDVPIINGIGDKTVLEGEELTFPIGISDLETAQSQLELTVTGLPAKASISGNQFRWVPSFGEAGNYQLTFEVCDGNLSSSETITITVISVERPQMTFSLHDKHNSPLNPGDLITYRMELTNIGQANLVDATVYGSIPSNTAYIAGSTRLNGLVIADIDGESQLITGLLIASPGEAPGVVSSGVDSLVVIEYSVRILNDLAPGALIRNQAKLAGSGYGSGPIQPLVSDNPETEAKSDATTSAVGSRPFLDAQMTVSDVDGSEVELEDELTYKVLVSNHGLRAATEVKFNNKLPEGVTFVEDSLTVLRNGSNELANYVVSDGEEILVDLGEIQGQDYLEMSYQVLVNSNFNPETKVLSNQGLVVAVGLPDELTDQDGDDSNGDQPTEIAVGLNPVILSRLEAKDLNGGEVLPGDTLEFSIIARNQGSAPASDLAISVAMPDDLTYLVNTTEVNGEKTTDITIQAINYGVIVPGEMVVANFQVQVPADTELGTAFTISAETSGIPLSYSIQVGGSPGSAGVTGTIVDSLDQNVSPVGWVVELYRNSVFLGNRVLDETGEYSFSGLQPDLDYQVNLRHPQSNVVYSNQTIENLQSGMVKEAILPMDPSGVIYDTVARTPVEGAIASIYGPDDKLVPAEGLLPGQQNQRTGADGRYRFDLRIGLEAPEGIYQIVVTPPTQYSQHFPSVLIEPTIDPASGAFDPPTLAEICPISESQDPPRPGDDTTYYLSFDLAVGDPDIINNHIPVDPDLGAALQITASADKTMAATGDFVTYTVMVDNLLPETIKAFTVSDMIPAGFKYVRGSATVNGNSTEAQGARPISFTGLTLAGGERLEIKYTLLIGTGVVEDLLYTNRVLAFQDNSGECISNTTGVGVRLTADPIFAEPVIIGKVFVDCDGDGLQQEGEEGLANIRLYTLSGRYIITDSAGRFHINADAVRMARGENFLIKLDISTLPKGAMLQSENPQVIRLTPGIMQKANFAIMLE